MGDAIIRQLQAEALLERTDDDQMLNVPCGDPLASAQSRRLPVVVH
ncbi:hypothetical protein [Cyanobium sp. WAJ14-Wanaka]|nr:hypothetical protein [Cyanobium sp. WAJ14-Wanaka]MCP9776212.1 hypothetical protein [Cyanobium sp. WAJ14-Wanaka]